MLSPHLLAAWPALDDGAGPVSPASLTQVPIAHGLINQTWALGRRYVLQRLHPIFRPEVNDDIAALVPHLTAGGVPVPRLVATADGAWSVRDADGAPWRILTRLPGETRHRLESPGDARSGAAMLARFHGALNGVAHVFAFERPGAHDTAAHVAAVRAALAEHRDHRLYDAVAELADTLDAAWERFGPLPTLPARIIHGDPKVSNLLWAGSDVVGVVDLDTMAWSGVDVELGDALRSWCNVGREDDGLGGEILSVRTFRATLGGYLDAAPWLTPAEKAALPRALERIALELSARFAADALRERYFGWDATRFGSRGDHNRVRAQNQLALALAAQRQRAVLEAVLERGR